MADLRGPMTSSSTSRRSASRLQYCAAADSGGGVRRHLLYLRRVHHRAQRGAWPEYPRRTARAASRQRSGDRNGAVVQQGVLIAGGHTALSVTVKLRSSRAHAGLRADTAAISPSPHGSRGRRRNGRPRGGLKSGAWSSRGSTLDIFERPREVYIQQLLECRSTTLVVALAERTARRACFRAAHPLLLRDQGRSTVHDLGDLRPLTAARRGRRDQADGQGRRLPGLPGTHARPCRSRRLERSTSRKAVLGLIPLLAVVVDGAHRSGLVLPWKPTVRRKLGDLSSPCAQLDPRIDPAISESRWRSVMEPCRRPRARLHPCWHPSRPTIQAAIREFSGGQQLSDPSLTLALVPSSSRTKRISTRRVGHASRSGRKLQQDTGRRWASPLSRHRMIWRLSNIPDR